jgi:hypothetical protein
VTIFNAAIAASADDAQQATTTVAITGVTIIVDGAGNWLGFRFQNVTIPQGSAINAATMSVYVQSGATDDPDVDIYCEAADNAATFAATANNISNRARTTAKTNWTAANIGTAWRTTPDFAAVVQEVTDRAGWASGNALAVIFDGLSASALRVRAYDNGAEYATITIDYTAPSSGNATARTARARLTSLIGGGLT